MKIPSRLVIKDIPSTLSDEKIIILKINLGMLIKYLKVKNARQS